MYSYDSLELYSSFLRFFKTVLSKANIYSGDKKLIDKFYINKTEQRKQKFLNRFGSHYATQSFTINGITYESLDKVWSSVDLNKLNNNSFYNLFHGDLQFDNIVYDPEINKFTYIDWRESFGGSTEGGDIYYDLAKLYGGCIIPYNLMKEESGVKLYEGSSIVGYSYSVPTNLTKFKKEYEKWITENEFDLDKVKLITAIIFLNMSPLHDDKFGKMLWFKSIELFNAFNK